MNMQNKKKALLVMAATNDYMFSVGNVLLGIKKYSPNVFDDILIFTDEKISENNLNALRQIFSNIMIEIYDFQIPNLDDRRRLSYYSNMPYSRFEMLKYLDIYEKVVWFDSDFLIQGDISGLLEYGRTGISMSLDLDPYPTTHNIKPFFVKDIDGYSMNTTAYASGLIIFSDKLKEPLLLREYLYKQLDRYSSYIKYAEQGILQLMIEDFGLKVDVFPKLIYHAFPFEDMTKAKIIHLLGDYKPWKTYLGSAFDEWYDNHIQWIELGGEEASTFASLLNTNKTNFHTIQELFTARANYKYFNGSKRYQNLLFFNSFYNNKVNTIEKVAISEK
ncbi:hypothetical protein AVANS14531_08020, partial [Campylobacter sp. Cr9]|uniref:glycosyltransferase n=1 Tax=Campylobacter sp. Cr9 TaxID=2735728 RepID=UPI0030153440|nr:hypothetical protein [Campylobacter sp. Cr9]